MEKYLKYKLKYLQLKKLRKQLGGGFTYKVLTNSGGPSDSGDMTDGINQCMFISIMSYLNNVPIQEGHSIDKKYTVGELRMMVGLEAYSTVETENTNKGCYEFYTDLGPDLEQMLHTETPENFYKHISEQLGLVGIENGKKLLLFNKEEKKKAENARFYKQIGVYNPKEKEGGEVEWVCDDLDGLGGYFYHLQILCNLLNLKIRIYYASNDTGIFTERQELSTVGMTECSPDYDSPNTRTINIVSYINLRRSHFELIIQNLSPEIDIDDISSYFKDKKETTIVNHKPDSILTYNNGTLSDSENIKLSEIAASEMVEQENMRKENEELSQRMIDRLQQEESRRINRNVDIGRDMSGVTTPRPVTQAERNAKEKELTDQRRHEELKKASETILDEEQKEEKRKENVLLQEQLEELKNKLIQKDINPIQRNMIKTKIKNITEQIELNKALLKEDESI